jgi:ribonuclease P/MRP protein subunit POP8
MATNLHEPIEGNTHAFNTIAANPQSEDAKQDVESPQHDRSNKSSRPNAALVHHTTTLRKPQWTYFHLAAVSSSTDLPDLDILTFRQNLTTALNQFLGLTGAAIDVDILKFEGAEAWIRVPREDASAVHEAVSGWGGTKSAKGQYKWIVRGRDDWLVRLVSGDGMGLYKS